MRLDLARPLFERPGPFLTLHVDVSRDTEDARQQIDSRWTRARHLLQDHGVSGPIVGEVEERLREPTHLPGKVRRTLVADLHPDGGGEILLDDARLCTSTWPETVTVGPLPDLAGWLSSVGAQNPFVLIRVDRVGADIEVHVAPSRPASEQTTVDGDTFDITKLPQGDWAQDKYQQRAENPWHANARLVADQVAALAERYRPRLVVVCGDVRARSDLASLLEDLLPAATGASVVTVESGGRAAGTSDEALWDDVRRLLAEIEARDTDAVLQRLERGIAVGEGVLSGPDRVAEAFVVGGVEELVLDLGEARAVSVAAADHPGLALPAVARDAGALPADQVLVAAAALTDAEVTLLPHEVPLPQELALANGVAATLRWDERTQGEQAQGGQT